MVTASELPIDTSANATQMAETIFGDGVTVTGATYYGDNDSSGIYTNGDSVSPGVTPGDTGVIMSTGDADDFTNSNGQANQDNNTSTNTSGINNFGQFNTAAGSRTFDASVLDVDFIPTGDLMTMKFVFSSEEYPEYQDSLYQDFVGVWINGSLVPMSVGNGDTDPGNINSGQNQNLYVDNANSDYNTEMDGFTVTMTLTIPVNSGVVNSIRIAIADVTDSQYDSNLLIAGDSVQTEVVALTDSTNLYPNGDIDLDVLANDVNGGGGTLTITHLNGQPVTVGVPVTLSTGQTIMLNADGTINIVGDGDTEEFNFTYTVDNGDNTDIGIVNVNSIPCFVAGTMIATPTGQREVQELVPGDLVLTQDEKAQPLRWIGTRTVAAQDHFAPIHIRANTFGTHNDLLVSPEHRILIQDNVAELLFGESEVLVAAKELINDKSVTRRVGGEVTYVHLMFDRHQVVYSEGLATESFLPGPQTTSSFDRAVVEEICTLFPEIDPDTGLGYSPAARRVLRHFEALLLRDAQKVA
ncbi:MAG: Hint domain-containing protein [Ascidiaceihabitans sp.]|uniref:Hint domain-containing protein n=1 Tax=Ascidiaceihabitans sp. TaxID=1872644 RepID=UPI00329A6300